MAALPGVNTDTPAILVSEKAAGPIKGNNKRHTKAVGLGRDRLHRRTQHHA